MSKCRMRTNTSEKMQFSSIKKTRVRMKYEWIGKTNWKKMRTVNPKNSKTQSEIAACEQKITKEKANFRSKTISKL